MTYQEKIALVDKGIDALNQGVSWDEWQQELASTGLYQKDINANGIKVINAIDELHGSKVFADLEASGVAQPVPGLHESVFTKLVERRTKQVQAKLSRTISEQILNGVAPEQALLQHQHPLLDEKVLRSAASRTQARAVEVQEKKANGSPVSLILGILFLVGGLGLTVASSGGTIFFGAIIVGLIMIVKFFVASID